MQVGKVVAVEAVPDSDKLWKCQIDVGDEKPKQIVAGLQQHLSLEQMDGLLAVIICNLKAAKLAGALRSPGLRACCSEQVASWQYHRLVGLDSWPHDCAQGGQWCTRFQKPTQNKSVQ